MNPKKLGLAAVSVLAAGAIIGGGAALASADPSPATSSSSTTAGAAANSGQAGADAGQAGANSGQPGAAGQAGGRGQGAGMHAHTAASAEETQKVTDAIKAKDSGATVSSVEKDEDGSCDAHGTKADGSQVRWDVSADYATVTEGQGGPGGKGGQGGPGGSQDTAVTGDEAQKVIDAVKAKDSTVTIDAVRKDADGSYDALGSKADGSKVMFDVSSDLATITEGQGRPGGAGGPGRDGGAGAPGATSSSGAGAANGTTTPTLPQG